MAVNAARSLVRVARSWVLDVRRACACSVLMVGAPTGGGPGTGGRGSGGGSPGREVAGERARRAEGQ
jgi:hypothetical protein